MKTILLFWLATVTLALTKGEDGNTTGWTDVVWDGIDALDDVTTTLKENDIVDVLKMLDDKTKPCFLGWETFFKFAM